MVADGKQRKRGASLGHLRPCPSAQMTAVPRGSHSRGRHEATASADSGGVRLLFGFRETPVQRKEKGMEKKSSPRST